MCYFVFNAFSGGCTFLKIHALTGRDPKSYAETVEDFGRCDDGFPREMAKGLAVVADVSRMAREEVKSARVIALEECGRRDFIENVNGILTVIDG